MSFLITRGLGGPLLITGGLIGSGTAAPTTILSDTDVYNDMLDRISIAIPFEQVRGAEEAGIGPQSSDVEICVTISTGREIDDPQYDFDQYVHTAFFEIAIECRSANPNGRQARLISVGNIIRNRINDVSLAGITIPGWTQITSATWTPDRQHPNATYVLHGQFATFVDSQTGYGENYTTPI